MCSDKNVPILKAIARSAFAAVVALCTAGCSAVNGGWPEIAVSRLPQALAPEYDDGIAALRRLDYSAALSKFTTAAKKGDGDALFFIGMLYDKGCGVRKNNEEARYFYDQGAMAHSAAAEFWLAFAMAFENAPAGKIDQLERQSAEGGYPPAMDVISEQTSLNDVERVAWKRVAITRWKKALGGRVGRDEWWSEREQALEKSQAKLSEAQVRTANQLADDLDRRLPLPRPGTVGDTLLKAACR